MHAAEQKLLSSIPGSCSFANNTALVIKAATDVIDSSPVHHNVPAAQKRALQELQYTFHLIPAAGQGLLSSIFARSDYANNKAVCSPHRHAQLIS